MSDTYNAFVVDEIEDQFKSSIKSLPLPQLQDGFVLIDVFYSSLNYKDALSASGNKGVTKSYPFTPGIDAVGKIRQSKDKNLKVGDKIGVNHFVAGQKVDLVGLSQGKGFSGAMKRHNFGGMQATHGVSISHRSHGSTGNSQDPGRTWKGKKMAGQYGNVRKTIQNLTVVQLIEEEDLILVKGGVPGSKNNILKMSDAIKHKTPENVPFPGGLKTSRQDEVKVEKMENEDKVSDQNVQNDGDKVEN